MSFGRWAQGKTALTAALLLLALLAMLALSQGGEPSGASGDERRIAEVLGVMAGVGKVEVALFHTPSDSAYGASENGALTGAVVVAQGADDMEVRLNLIRAVRTLLGLPENAVDVFLMEDGGS